MKVLLVPNETPATQEAARLLASRLTIAGLDAVVQPAQNSAVPAVPVEEIALVVPMGGDGTFLAAARLTGFSNAPLLGLNLGTLGFLSGNPERDKVELIIDALSGDLPFERRATLHASVECADGSVCEYTALNEVAYTRGASGHLVEFSYSVNGIPIADLRADGLVVSTATGSTAYALSAGGPIVSPGYGGLVVVPVAPHTINSRALVLAPSDVLEVTIGGRSAGEASLFVDGVTVDAGEPAFIQLKRGENDCLFARGGGDFFTNVARVFFNKG